MQSLSVICRGNEVPLYTCYSQWIVRGLVVVWCLVAWYCDQQSTVVCTMGTKINRNLIKEKKTVSDKKNLFRELITLNV